MSYSNPSLFFSTLLQLQESEIDSSVIVFCTSVLAIQYINLDCYFQELPDTIKKHSKGKSAEIFPEILQETYELEDRNTELQNEGYGYSQKVTDENVESETPEQTTSQFTVTPSTSRGNKRGSPNNVAKKGGYSSNVGSIHGVIHKLAKI